MVDRSTINSVKGRDESAFKKLYECCIRYVFTIVRRYVTNESDHEDVIQEIFARLYLSIDTFDESKGEFKFWLRRLTINLCIQHYRKRAKSGIILPIDKVPEMQSDAWEKMSLLSRKELLLYLKNMPEGYKQIFMLVIIDEFSHQEAGQILGITPETSRSQLHRAKKWLQSNLSNKSLKLLAG